VRGDSLFSAMQNALPLRTGWGDAGDVMSVILHDDIFVRCFRVETCKKDVQKNSQCETGEWGGGGGRPTGLVTSFPGTDY